MKVFIAISSNILMWVKLGCEGFDTAFWEGGGHFNDRRPPEVEEVRAQGNRREREKVALTKLRGEEHHRNKCIRMRM